MGRKAGEHKGIHVFEWNLKAMSLDHDALKGTDAVVHLAGASIGERLALNRTNALSLKAG